MTESRGQDGRQPAKPWDTLGQVWDKSNPQILGRPKQGDAISFLQTHPSQPYHYQAIAQAIGAKPSTVRRDLGRKARYGKGSGPVKRTTPGFFMYEPHKTGLIEALIREGRICIENAEYVSQDPPRVGVLSQAESGPGVDSCPKSGTVWDTVGTSLGQGEVTSREGYPIRLPGGGEVRWLVHKNGTQEVRIVSGKYPLSLDLYLYLREGPLKAGGMEGVGWRRTSIEYNIDGRRVRISPDSITLQEDGAEIHKIYMHGPDLRSEIADRRELSNTEALKEEWAVMEHIDARLALKKVDKLESEMKGIRYLPRTVQRLVDDVEGLKSKKRRRSK